MLFTYMSGDVCCLFLFSLKNGMVFRMKQACCCGRSRAVQTHAPLNFQNNKEPQISSLHPFIYLFPYSFSWQLFTQCLSYVRPWTDSWDLKFYKSQQRKTVMKVLCLVLQRQSSVNVPALHKHRHTYIPMHRHI